MVAVVAQRWNTCLQNLIFGNLNYLTAVGCLDRWLVGWVAGRVCLGCRAGGLEVSRHVKARADKAELLVGGEEHAAAETSGPQRCPVTCIYPVPHGQNAADVSGTESGRESWAAVHIQRHANAVFILAVEARPEKRGRFSAQFPRPRSGPRNEADFCMVCLRFGTSVGVMFVMSSGSDLARETRLALAWFVCVSVQVSV
jgi:hypothetical protein